MWPTIIVLAIVALIAGLAIRSVIKQRKSGGCSACPSGCDCSTSEKNKCCK